MKYKPLGNTGLHVSELCFGAMTFNDESSAFGGIIGSSNEAGAQEMIDRAIDAGINFFDTANMYGEGSSERMLGQAIGKRRKDAVIATKVFFPFDNDMNSLGLSRVAIMREVEDSLRRLGTDYIDLYQVHTFDNTTPLEETLRSLDDLVRAGKVRYIGLSNFAAWQIAKAVGISERLGLERFQSVQAYYSLVGRELEYEILPAVRDMNLGVMVWSPLAGGYLSGKYTDDGDKKGRRAAFEFPPVGDRADQIVGVLREIAAAHDASPARIALAWLLHQQGVTTVIIGARKMDQLEDNLKAVDVELSADELARLDEVSAPPVLYPNWMPALPRGTTMADALANLS